MNLCVGTEELTALMGFSKIFLPQGSKFINNTEGKQCYEKSARDRIQSQENLKKYFLQIHVAYTYGTDMEK